AKTERGILTLILRLLFGGLGRRNEFLVMGSRPLFLPLLLALLLRLLQAIPVAGLLLFFCSGIRGIGSGWRSIRGHSGLIDGDLVLRRRRRGPGIDLARFARWQSLARGLTEADLLLLAGLLRASGGDLSVLPLAGVDLIQCWNAGWRRACLTRLHLGGPAAPAPAGVACARHVLLLLGLRRHVRALNELQLVGTGAGVDVSWADVDIRLVAQGGQVLTESWLHLGHPDLFLNLI